MTGKQFATIITITFIVGMVWLASDIIFNTKPSIPANPQIESLLKTVTPTFNSRIIEIIDQEIIETNLIQSTVSTPGSVRISAPSASPANTATNSGAVRI